MVYFYEVYVLNFTNNFFFVILSKRIGSEIYWNLFGASYIKKKNEKLILVIKIQTKIWKSTCFNISVVLSYAMIKHAAKLTKWLINHMLNFASNFGLTLLSKRIY